MFCRPSQCTLVVWLVLARGILAAATVGESSKSGTQRDFVNHWTSEHGIPHNRVNALAQTPDGYLWVGTWRGLARFDGVRFAPFTLLNRPEMTNDTVNALTVDNEGTLWIGLQDGLLKYEHGQFTRFAKASGLRSRSVWRLASCPMGGVWLDCGGNVVHWQKDRPEVVVSWRTAPDENMRSLHANADGSVTVVTSRAIKRVMLTGELKTVPVPDYPGTPGSDWGGAISTADTLWLNAAEGLWRYRDGSWKQTLSGWCNAYVGTLIQSDQRGSLWVSRLDAGFWRCRDDSAVPVKLGDYGAEKSVICMLEDAEGHLWFGTPYGLFQLRPRLISTYTTEDGLPNAECHSVCQGPDSAVWMETKGGVVRLRGSRAERFSDEPARNRRRPILVDRKNTVWLGNGHHGLVSWTPGMRTNWFWDVGPSVTVQALYLARDGRLWVGTDRGVTWFEDGQPAGPWGTFGLPMESVKCIYQTRDGAMWFGTKNGVIRWQAGAADSPVPAVNPMPANVSSNALPSLAARVPPPSGTLTRYTASDGLADDAASVFHQDADGVLWIGTYNGLSRLVSSSFSGPDSPMASNASPRFFSFRTEHGLLDNAINWLEEDDLGRFWFTCDRGIFRIDRRELNAVTEGRKPRANSAVYGMADGLINPATSGEHQPAGCKGRDGRLWFPTSHGVVVIDPRNIQDNAVAPAAVIEEVVADGETVWTDGVRKQSSKTPGLELILPPGRARVLKIQYTANSFADPRRVQFLYRLEGLDHAWREVTDERVAYYTDLKPGRYVFQVKAANAHGLWNEKPAEFPLVVSPHFWQTWPFYAGCAVGIVMLVAGLQSYRLRSQRRLLELQQRNALEQERARIARDLHDNLGANLTGIALKADLAQRHMQSAPVGAKLADIAASARALVDNMRGTVWALNPEHDTLEGLARFLAQQVEDLVTDAGLRCRLELPERFPDLTVPSPARYHIHLVVKEALHNAVKHAAASEVRFSLKIDGDNLCLSVADDGHGFDAGHAQFSTRGSERSENGGHGLVNMRQRIESLKGEWKIESNEKGTCVRIQVPTRSFQPAST